MILCPACNGQSPDGSQACVHCGYAGGPINTVPKQVVQPDFGAPQSATPMSQQTSGGVGGIPQPSSSVVPQQGVSPQPQQFVAQQPQQFGTQPQQFGTQPQQFGVPQPTVQQVAPQQPSKVKKILSEAVHSVWKEFDTNMWNCAAFLIALCIPILNIVTVVKIGFVDNNAPPVKRAFVRGYLIVGVIAIVLSILFAIFNAIFVACTVGNAFRSAGW